MAVRFRKYGFIFLFITIVFTDGTNAQDGTFTASANPNPVAAAEQFQLTLTFSGTDINGLKNFKPPNFNQFVVISGPNQSTSRQWVNGAMSGSLSYVYMLYARQPGKYTIGAANIEYKGKNLSSNPLTINVTQGKPKQPENKGNQDMAAGTRLPF